jgi:hypothetical protein
VFPFTDPQTFTLLCGKCGERVVHDLRDGAVSFGHGETIEPPQGIPLEDVTNPE